MKLDVIHDVTLLSLIVMVVSILASIGLYCWSSGPAAANSCSSAPPGRTCREQRAAAPTKSGQFRGVGLLLGRRIAQVGP